MSANSESTEKILNNEKVDFGNRVVKLEQKQGLVNNVFNNVASSYDLMNDLMSFGVHRLWKEALLDWIAPRPNQILADLAGGTGDIAIRFLQRGGQSAHVIDINEKMMAEGRKADRARDKKPPSPPLPLAQCLDPTLVTLT